LKITPWLDRPFVSTYGLLKRRCRTQQRSSTQDCADNHFQSTEPLPRSGLTKANSKVADLAGAGFGNYTQLEKVLPNDYRSALTGGRRHSVPHHQRSQPTRRRRSDRPGGHQVQEGRAEEATGNVRPDGLPEIPVSPGNHQERNPAEHRRRNRTGTMMLLLRKTHLGEVTVSVWLKV